MTTPITSAATDQATDWNGEPTTTPWHDVRDHRTAACTPPPVLIASHDKPARDRIWPAADAQGHPG